MGWNTLSGPFSMRWAEIRTEEMPGAKQPCTVFVQWASKNQCPLLRDACTVLFFCWVGGALVYQVVKGRGLMLMLGMRRVAQHYTMLLNLVRAKNWMTSVAWSLCSQPADAKTTPFYFLGSTSIGIIMRLLGLWWQLRPGCFSICLNPQICWPFYR